MMTHKPLHPGPVFASEFDVRDVGIDQEYLDAVLQGTERMSANVCIILGEHTGTSPEKWYGMQALCDLWEASVITK